MNQKLEHGMKVRAKMDIYDVETRNYKWNTAECVVSKSSSGCVFIGGILAFGDGEHDYSDLFDIIPEPMTAEEAMDKIIAWEDDINSQRRLMDIIDEYKKGLGDD